MSVLHKELPSYEEALQIPLRNSINHPWLYRKKRFSWASWERNITSSDGSIATQWGSGGITSTSQTEPRIFFTCGNKPRQSDTSIQTIRQDCFQLAKQMTSHQDHPTKPCRCPYWHLKRTGKCLVSRRSQRCSRNVQAMIQRHDRVCACGCFEF